jgi:hypothetical protein
MAGSQKQLFSTSKQKLLYGLLGTLVILMFWFLAQPQRIVKPEK